MHPLATTVVCAVAVLFSFLVKPFQNRRTRRWPTVDGKASLLQCTHQDTGYNRVDRWVIRLTYTYSVTSENTGYLDLEVLLETQKTRILQAIQTQPVRVHYNPHKEEESVLWEDEILALKAEVPALPPA